MLFIVKPPTMPLPYRFRSPACGALEVAKAVGYPTVVATGHLRMMWMSILLMWVGLRAGATWSNLAVHSGRYGTTRA